MNRMKLRMLLPVTAVFAALCVPVLGPAQLTAQNTAIEPEHQEQPLLIAAPSWQRGDYWAEFDHKLLVDFADLARFRDADQKMDPPAAGEGRVVFMGDSITQGWKLEQSFPGKPYVNRGISGQSSSQMLLRFRQDVIDLQPKVVVLLAGTNDIAENTGPVTLGQVEGNLKSMAQLATANGIRVVLCSVLPATHFWWHPELKDPAPRIAALNKRIRSYAAEKGFVYVDFYSAMADPAGGLPKKLSPDGVHPSPAGYAVMAPLAESGIEKALE